MECSWYDVPCGMNWAFDEINIIIINLIDSLLQALASVYAAIPVPTFMQSASFSLPSSVIYMADIFAIPEGVAMIVSAYTLRFVLRRIPGIG